MPPGKRTVIGFAPGELDYLWLFKPVLAAPKSRSTTENALKQTLEAPPRVW
jgi:hypothetical protein